MPNLQIPQESNNEREEREVEELVQKVKEAKEEALEKLMALGTHAESLRQRVRRVASEMASPLVLYATANMRFAGAAVQGLRRTSGVDRIVERAKTNREENIRIEEERLKRDIARKAEKKAHQKVEQYTFPVDPGAVDELYGEGQVYANIQE
jgi:hypothetical protein